MQNYAFANSVYQIEVYETGEFEKVEDAVDYAKTMADEMDMDIEVWEEKIIVQPFTSFIDGGMMDGNEAVEIRERCLKNEVSALSLLREVCEEVAKEPCQDSDLVSLLGTLRSRAKLALRLANNANGADAESKV